MRSRTTREKWSARSLAVSLAISASWHLLVLAVLVLAVHPFQLPMEERSIELRLLPPLPPILKPPEPIPKLKLRPAPPDLAPLEPAPAKPPTPLERAQPLPQIQSPAKPEPEPVPPQPVEQARPQPNILAKPVEVDRAPSKTPAKPLDRSRPVIEPKPVEAPPAPLDVTRPNPSVLPPPLNVPRPAPATARPLQANRAAPAVPAPPAPAPAPPAPASAPPAPSEAIVTAPPAPAVLTNEQVIQAPVEIRPPERSRTAAPDASLPGAAGIPSAVGQAGGGAPTAGGGAAGGGGAGGGVRRPGLGDFRGSVPLNGMTMRLGCISPDTYRLTPEERAACLDRFGAAARGVGDLGPNIPADKQAEYDRQAACKRTYKDQGMPASNDASDGTSVKGLGANPSLKACGPGDR
jgi:hypothetical protein